MPFSITLTDADALEYLRMKYGPAGFDDAPSAAPTAVEEPRRKPGRPPKAATTAPTPLSGPGSAPVAPAPQKQQTIEEVEAAEKLERAKRERMAVSPAAAGPALPAIEREDYRAWCRDAAMKLGGGAGAVAAIKEIHGGRTIDQLQPAEFQPSRIKIEALLGERGAAATAAPPGL